MSLGTLRHATARRFDCARSHFDKVSQWKPVTRQERIRRWRELEGIASFSWQTLCGFSRAVVVRSILGTTTSTGRTLSPVNLNIKEENIISIAYQLRKRARNINPSKTIPHYNEPTWADRSLLLDVVSFLNPANEANLRIGLTYQTRAWEDLRTVRNAAAHINSVGMKDVKKLTLHYVGGRITHPLDILLAHEVNSGDNCFHYWLTDLEDCVVFMTS